MGTGTGIWWFVSVVGLVTHIGTVVGCQKFAITLTQPSPNVEQLAFAILSVDLLHSVGGWHVRQQPENSPNGITDRDGDREKERKREREKKTCSNVIK